MKGAAYVYVFAVAALVACVACASDGARAVRYFSNDGDDSADGLTPATAWRTIEKLGSDLPAGGEARLRRGDTFFGRVKLKPGPSAASRTVLAAYGEGARPEISAYKVARPDPAVWEPAGADCLWRIDLSDHSRFGGNHMTDDGNVGFLKVDGRIFGRKFFAKGSGRMDRQWDFIDDGRCLTVWSRGNPALVARDIRIAPCMSVIPFGDNIEVRDVAVRGTGSHGAHGSGRNVRFFDCAFYEIGGSHLKGHGNGMSRFGNGLECWAGASDVQAVRCEFADIYDVGFTMQGGWPSRPWKDIHVADCVFSRCSQCYELWASKCRPGVGMVNCTFVRNRCEDTGRGWGYDVRPDKANAVPLLMYKMESDTCDVLVRGNEFVNSRGFLVYKSGGLSELPETYRIEANTIVGPAGAPLANCIGKDRSAAEDAREKLIRAANAFVYVAAGPDVRGAAEFDVARPGKGAVAHAADFGVVADGRDCTAALNNALNACRSNGVGRLVFGRGVYRFAGGRGIAVDSMRDFVLDGAGAEFVFFRKSGVNFDVRNCERLEMRDFSVDWDWERDPLASLVTVEDRAADHVDFRFVHYDRFPRRDVRVAYTSPWDAETQSVGVLGKGSGRGFDMSWGHGKKRPLVRKEWLGGNLLRVYAAVGPEFKQGDLYRMQHYYYDLGGFSFCDNSDVFMENVEVKSCAGHAFHFTGDRRVHFRNVNVRVPKDDARRVITCTADHFHIKRSLGFFKLEHCEFSRGADDCVNMHDVSAFAKGRPNDFTVRARHVGKDLFRAGDRVEIRRSDYADTGFVSALAEVRAVPGGGNMVDLVFSERVPPLDGDGFVLFNRRFDTHNVIIRDCFFHDNRARGVIVQCPDVTLERCRFLHHESEAIKVTTGWTEQLWCEGYGVTNLVVRDCVFERTNAAGGKGQAVFVGTYRKVPSYERIDMSGVPMLRDVVFEGNRFVDIPAYDMLIGSVSNIVLRGNTFLSRDSSGQMMRRDARTRYVGQAR